MDNKTKFVLIRNLTAEDNRMLQGIKQETGCRQASKALLRAGHDYLRILATNGLQKKKMAMLEEENRKLHQSLKVILQAIKEMESVIKNDT